MQTSLNDFIPRPGFVLVWYLLASQGDVTCRSG